MKRILLLIMLLALSLALSGCLTGGNGTLALQLTDAPSELNIEQALITVSNIAVHTAGTEVETEETAETEATEAAVAETEETATTETETTEAGWKMVVEKPQTFDLIAIKDVKELLGEAQLPAGKYTQVRLSIDRAWVTIDGTEYQLEVPSDKLKLTHGFDIVAGKTTTLTLDFDAQESITAAGKDKYLLRPTIKIVQE